MLSQVGSVTTNGLQQQTIFANTDLNRLFGAPPPAWPGVLTPAPLPDGVFPLFSGVRVFHRDYDNPRSYSANVAYEQEFLPALVGLCRLHRRTGLHLTRFLNYNRSDPSCCDQGPGTGNVYNYGGSPWGLALGEVAVTTSRGKSLYHGLTLGVRKRLSDGHQLERNYVLSRDQDDDSNERDPFTDRSFNFFDPALDYGLSDRDIRHKFNLFGYFEVPLGLQLTRASRRAARSRSRRARGSLERQRSRPQHRAQGQRVLHPRLAALAAVPHAERGRNAADVRDVQHLQQRQQHQPALHAGALQLRRIPAHGRGRPAAGAVGGEGGVLSVSPAGQSTGNVPASGRLGSLSRRPACVGVGDRPLDPHRPPAARLIAEVGPHRAATTWEYSGCIVRISTPMSWWPARCAGTSTTAVVVDAVSPLNRCSPIALSNTNHALVLRGGARDTGGLGRVDELEPSVFDGRRGNRVDTGQPGAQDAVAAPQQRPRDVVGHARIQNAALRTIAEMTSGVKAATMRAAQ